MATGSTSSKELYVTYSVHMQWEFIKQIAHFVSVVQWVQNKPSKPCRHQIWEGWARRRFPRSQKDNMPICIFQMPFRVHELTDSQIEKSSKGQKDRGGGNVNPGDVESQHNAAM